MKLRIYFVFDLVVMKERQSTVGVTGLSEGGDVRGFSLSSDNDT